MLFSLLLLNDDCSLKVEIILLFKDIKERRVGTTVDTDLLELISEMILDGLLFEAVSLKNDVVLAFEDEAVDYEIFLLEQVCLLQEADNFFSVNIVITFLDIHCHKVELRLVYFLPFEFEFLILLHDVVVVEDCEAKLMLIHLALQILEHHMSEAKFLVCSHILGMRQLSVKGHDRSESVSLWNQSKFARGKVMIFTMAIHFALLDCSQIILQ